MFPEESWQRGMVADCRTMFTVKPKRGFISIPLFFRYFEVIKNYVILFFEGEAILFYSQLPDGKVDPMSIHGGCPVLSGTKWAANLWVWNGPRNGHMIRDEITGKHRVVIFLSKSS